MRRSIFWFGVPITPYASPLRGVSGTFGALPLQTDADAAAYSTRCNRLAVTFASYEARLRSQMARGIVVPADELRLAVPFLRGFGGRRPRRARSGRRGDRRALPRRHGRRVLQRRSTRRITDVVNPAVERLAAFWTDRIARRRRRRSASSQYPGGRDYYQFLIRRNTSLDADA